MSAVTPVPKASPRSAILSVGVVRVDGEAHGVGVTKLPKEKSMAERGLGLGTGVTADIDIGGVAARAALLRRYAHPST